MKVTEDYLKQIIKEELQELQGLNQTSIATSIANTGGLPQELNEEG
jgi:hypothetical protein